MSRRRSPVVGKRYPLRTVCEVWCVPRSSVYALAAASALATPTAKRGPKTAQSDLEVVALIRAILATSPSSSASRPGVGLTARSSSTGSSAARPASTRTATAGHASGTSKSYGTARASPSATPGPGPTARRRSGQRALHTICGDQA